MFKSESLTISDKEAAAVAVAPRVTLEDIENNILFEAYVTGEEALALSKLTGVPEQLNILTLCLMTLRNGFTIIGHSAPASAENFDRQLGRKIARENAVRQIWPLMGYALRDKLSHQG